MKNKYALTLFAIVIFLSATKTEAQTTVVDSFMHDNIWRNYRIFLPAGFSSSVEAPLVLNLHGYTSTAN